MTDGEKKAVDLVTLYGMIDGAHHKQWVIDQMLRAIMTEAEYTAWRAEMDGDPDYEPWNEGIAP